MLLTHISVVLEDAASYLSRTGLNGRHFTVHPPKALLNGYTNGVDSDVAPKVFVVSSNDKEGVSRNVERLTSYLSTASSKSSFLNSLAYTLASKRSVLPWKSFAIASSLEQLKESLVPSNLSMPIRSSSTSDPRLAFVFTGQGAQWYAMGRGLSIYPAFQASMDASEKMLRSDFGCRWSLSEELSKASEEECNLRKTDYSQPACTAVQIALVDLLTSWGVKPVAVVGHSSGEIAAAYCAGLISHAAGMKVAWLRGQVSATVAQNGTKGGMLAVSASGESLQEKLNGLKSGKAIVGCLNSPKACTVSGDAAAVDELQEILKAEQITCTRLPMDVAYHSFHMESVRDQYEAALVGIPHVASQETIPMFSSVTGALVTPKQMSPSYWIENLVRPVNFSGATAALLNYTKEKRTTHDRRAFADIFVEVGPHSALRSYMLDIFNSSETKFADLSYESMLRRKFDGTQTALQAMGNLWAKGFDVDLNKVNGVSPDSASTKMLVDLPPYSWNHKLTFWDESHLSKAYRLREKPRLDLLGYPVAGVPDPTWRNFLRCNENPWIREHKVQGNILYPGAGMLVMAIEGAKQLAESANNNEVIYGYELRDVSIVTALRVPDTEKGVEVMVQFHPRRTGTKAAPSTSLNEFTVSSWSEATNEWVVHARGMVSVTYASSLSPAMQKEIELQDSANKAAFTESREICQRPARSFLYDTIETVGMQYGPTFRNMTELYAGPNASYGVISVPDTKSVMPMGFEYPCVIHPATLDSVLHLLFPSISGEEQSISEAVVPVSFDRVFVSADIPNTPGTNLHGMSTAKKMSYTTWTSSITISDESHASPLIIMEGLGLASIGGDNNADAVETRASCFDQVWHEDVDLLEPSHIKELVYKRTIPNADDESVLDLLEYVCLVHIDRCLNWLQTPEGKQHTPQDGFWKLYVEWMEVCRSMFPPLDADPAAVEAKLESARQRIALSESGDITVQMVDRIGENLANIFMRKVEPLQVMTEGDLLYTFYRGAFGTSFNTNVAEYVGLIADKNPGLAILEIGAGTGGTTYHVLERLRNEDGSSKAKKYLFTDISPGFLGKAQDRFVADASIMEFATCNIENDPIGQGFQPETFDLIVCANVLHATQSIQETLAHCRTLLKPGGKLVLSEVTIKRIFSGFIMGPLPGWWLGEADGRTGGPLMDVEEWEVALKKASFSGVDMDVRGDRETSNEPVSLIISTKAASRPKPATTYAIVSTGSVQSKTFATALQSSFNAAGLEASILKWGAFTETDIADRYCISLAEWEEPMLATLTDDNWSKLRQMLSKSVGTLWITGGAAMECTHPMQSLMVGLSRAIRNEDAGILLATLDVDAPEALNDVAETTDAVLRVAVDHSRGDREDGEFASRGKTIFVPRVERVPKVDASLRRYEAKGEPELVSLTGCGRPLKLTIKTPGLLDTFRWYVLRACPLNHLCSYLLV